MAAADQTSKQPSAQDYWLLQSESHGTKVLEDALGTRVSDPYKVWLNPACAGLGKLWSLEVHRDHLAASAHVALLDSKIVACQAGMHSVAVT